VGLGTRSVLVSNSNTLASWSATYAPTFWDQKDARHSRLRENRYFHTKSEKSVHVNPPKRSLFQARRPCHLTEWNDASSRTSQTFWLTLNGSHPSISSPDRSLHLNNRTEPWMPAFSCNTSSDSSLHIRHRLSELRVWSSYGECGRMQAFRVFPCISLEGDFGRR